MTQKPSVSFRVLARSVFLMGAELVTDPAVAVVELVKNSWDAGATLVEVSVDRRKRAFSVRDDGVGMTSSDVIDRWLAVGTGGKLPELGAPKPRTPLGNRVTQGEKGIGRLSAQRLGRYLKLVTRAKNPKTGALSPDESVLEVDWNLFLDPTKELQDVPVSVSTRKPQVFLESSGTLIETKDPSEAVFTVQSDVDRLKWNLAKLCDPLSSVGAPMQIRLMVDSKVINPYDAVKEVLDRSLFQLSGEVSVDWHFTGTLQTPWGTEKLDQPLRPRVEYQMDTKRSVPQDYPFVQCGTFKVRIFAFERRGRGENQQKVVEYLDQVAQGVMIYRDGVRVLPYGNPGDDWLYLDKAASTAAKDWFANRQVLGFVSISRDQNGNLVDKTNREGLVENSAFVTFRGLLWAVLIHLHAAKRRFAKIREGPAIVDPVRRVVEQIRPMIQDPSVSEAVKTRAEAIVGTVRAFARQVEQRELTTALLSGLGLAAERTTHELAKLLASLREILESLAQDKELSRKARSKVQECLDLLTAVERELWLLEPLYFRSRSEESEFDVAEVTKSIQTFFQKDVRRSGVRLDVSVDKPLRLLERRGLLMQTLFNLIDNALYWASTYRGGAGRVQIQVQGNLNRILVLDNGPGIKPEDRHLIFEPLWSTKPGGRGMGLYIVKTLLEERGHKIWLSVEPSFNPLGGATFVVEFKPETVVAGGN